MDPLMRNDCHKSDSALNGILLPCHQNRQGTGALAGATREIFLHVEHGSFDPESHPRRENWMPLGIAQMDMRQNVTMISWKVSLVQEPVARRTVKTQAFRTIPQPWSTMEHSCSALV